MDVGLGRDRPSLSLEPEKVPSVGLPHVHSTARKPAQAWAGDLPREVLRLFLTGSGYYLASLLGLQARFPGVGISLFWPANAFLLAVLLLTPMRRWWPCLLVVLPAHLLVVSAFQPGVPAATMICQYAGNLVQAVVAALAVSRFIGRPPPLDRLGSMASYITLAALLAPALASALVAWLFVLTGWTDDYWFTLRQRFLGNVVPSLTIPPLIILAARRWRVELRQVPWRRYAEVAAVLSALLVVHAAVFGKEPAGPLSSTALVYAPLPLLLWAAVRFGVGGVCLSLLIFAFLSLSATFAGRGPFTVQSPEANAISLQIFLIGTAIPLMLLAALVEERRRSEGALRESQQRYGLAAAAGGVGVWEWNLETNRIYVDRALRALFGLEANEAGDDPNDWLRLVHPDDLARLQSLVRANLAGEAESFDAEYRALHKDGSSRWFLSRGAIERDGGPRRLIGTSTDITQRKLAEEQARVKVEEARVLASQIAHLNRIVTVGELSAAIAHEISQPLTGVMHNAEAAIRLLERAEPDWQEVRAALGDIVEDDRRASDVIGRVRGLLRRETSLHSLLDMRHTVEQVLPLVHRDVVERGISLDVRLGSAALPVMGERTQLQQVLLNLLLNAFDALAAAPVAGRQVVLAAEVAGDRVVVSIADNGPGVPDDELDLLFQPFFTTKPTGIGLGLSICRTIVASHDGSLEARRNPDGGGMTFSLTLPLSAPSS